MATMMVDTRVEARRFNADLARYERQPRTVTASASSLTAEEMEAYHRWYLRRFPEAAAFESGAIWAQGQEVANG